MAEIRTSSTSAGKIGIIEGTFTKNRLLMQSVHRGYCAVEEEEKGVPLLLGGRRGGCYYHKRAVSERLWFASLKRCSINQVWKILHAVS